MVTIRLQRVGKSNQADYRIVLTKKTTSADKNPVEVLGSYNPRSKAFVLKDKDRVLYWVNQRVPLSATVHNLFVSQGVITGTKTKAFAIPKKEVVAEPEVVVSTSTPEVATTEVQTEVVEATPTETQNATTSPEAPAEAPPSEENPV